MAALSLAALACWLPAALSGCGQKGPLTLAAPVARPAGTAVPADLPASSVSPTALPASQPR